MMTTKKQKNNEITIITSGKTDNNDLEKIIKFALPLMLGYLFQQFYTAVDSIVVGNFVSKQALAAVGTTTPIVNMLIGFF